MSFGYFATTAMELDVVRIAEMDVDVTGDEYWAAVDDEYLKHGCEFVEKFSGDRSGTVDGQRHNVWSRELEPGQHEFESAPNEIDWNSFRADAIPVDYDGANPLLSSIHSGQMLRTDRSFAFSCRVSLLK